MGCDPGLLTGGAALEAERARFEALWGTAVPTVPGLNLLEMIEAAARDELKCLWIVGYDVLPTLPNRNATRDALARLETVIVQDIFINETAREFATIFLPAASVFEHDGTFMNSERRIQRVRQAVPPPGEARPDWQILCDVARAMGRGAGFGFGSDREIWDEVRAAWPGGAGVTGGRLDESGVQWPCRDEHAPGTEYLYGESFGVGPRARLACIDYVPTAETVTPEFPLLLTTGRSLYQFNAGTMTGRGRTRDLRPTDLLEIHPVDAAAAGLETGDTVEVRSRYGEVRLRAQVTRPRAARRAVRHLPGSARHGEPAHERSGRPHHAGARIQGDGRVRGPGLAAQGLAAAPGQMPILPRASATWPTAPERRG